MTQSTTKLDHLKSWQKDRFGMFIHWGIYSMVGINEWCRPSKGTLSHHSVKSDVLSMKRRFLY